MTSAVQRDGTIGTVAMLVAAFFSTQERFMNRFGYLRSSHLLAALAVTVSIAPGLANAGSSVPLIASIAIQETVQPTGSPCVFTSTVSGTGTATHLGKVTLHSTDCINVAGPGTLTFASTELFLTAANGDQIHASYSGTFEPATGLINGGFRITGGTGRFAQASGAGMVEGVEDVSHHGLIELTGTISY